MKQLGWVWATALYQAVQGQGQNQNTTVLNPRLYYFEEWFNSYTAVQFSRNSRVVHLD